MRIGPRVLIRDWGLDAYSRMHNTPLFIEYCHSGVSSLGFENIIYSFVRTWFLVDLVSIPG